MTAQHAPSHPATAHPSSTHTAAPTFGPNTTTCHSLTAGGRRALNTARSRVAAANAKVQSAYGGGE